MWILEPKSCVYPKFRDWYGWIPSPQLRRTLRTAQLRKWELPPTLSSNLARSIMAGSMLSVWMAWQPAHIYGGFHSHGCTPPHHPVFWRLIFHEINQLLGVPPRLWKPLYITKPNGLLPERRSSHFFARPSLFCSSCGNAWRSESWTWRNAWTTFNVNHRGATMWGPQTHYILITLV